MNHAFHVLQGKYVEIQFSRGGEPIGGKISNFLLEKVRDGFSFSAYVFRRFVLAVGLAYRAFHQLPVHTVYTSFGLAASQL